VGLAIFGFLIIFSNAESLGAAITKIIAGKPKESGTVRLKSGWSEYDFA
jgi:hypothetical protein